MAAGGVILNPEDPKFPDPESSPQEDLSDNPEIDKFFHRLPSNLRWPKPSADAVAAAMEAVQRLSAEPMQNDSAAPLASAPGCAGCGEPLGEGMRFCGHCGLAI